MRSLLPPILILSALTVFAFCNSLLVADCTERCITPLDDASAFANAENWAAAKSALSDSFAHWQRWRSYLRITASHDIVDAADSMYLRAFAFAETRERSEFRAESAGLRSRLCHLAEIESFHPEIIF